MGISTVAIGLLPTYETIGILAPVLLALARFGQGLGLGGEWGGAALLATENAPARKRALYGSFPQLGAPIGFFFANGTFLLLSWLLTDEQFISWGSAYSVCLLCRTGADWSVCARLPARNAGLCQSRGCEKTGKSTAGNAADQTRPRDRAGHVYHAGNLYAVLHHDRLLHDVQHRRRAGGAGSARNEVLWMLMMAVIGFGVMVPIAGLLADKFGRRSSMIVITTLIILFALFVFPPLLGSGSPALVMAYLLIGLSLMASYLRPDGRAAAGAVPDGSALYGRVVLLQRSLNSGRIRCAVYRYLAAGELWSVLCGRLSGGHGGADADCAAADARN